MALPFPDISAAAAARTPVGVGNTANDNLGDALRTAFIRSNARDTGLELALDQAKANLDNLDGRTVALEGSAMFLNARGAWDTATAYVYTPGLRRDYFIGPDGTAYITLVSHTSTSIAADLVAGRIGNIDEVQLRADLALSGAGLGADMVAFIQSGADAVARGAKEKMREWATLDDYLTPAERAAALSGAVLDMTTNLNRALAAHKHVRAVSGRTYRFTTLNMAQNDACLEIEAGARLMPSSAVVTAINVSGQRCAITGVGSIDSPASWDGTNARRTFATIWVTGEGFFASGFTLNNVPRSGIHFEDGTGWLVIGVKINGGFPYASYTGTQTGHCGIDYNPPTTAAATDYQSGRVIGCRIRQCVQGVFYGNFDSYGSTAGVAVVGNVFEDCWNHGIYMTLGESTVVNGNTFVDCQNPIVVDGAAAVVTGNVLYTTEPNTRTNSWQIIQVREPNGAVIANNVLIGVDAGISLDCVTGTSITNCIVSGNRVHRTARASTSFGIRLGINAQTCQNNKITGNTITGVMGIHTGSAIELNMAATFFGYDNEVTDNIVDMTDPAQCLYTNLQRRPVFRGNKLKCAGGIASADAVRMMFVIATTQAEIRENRFLWESGGANVACRGIQTSGTVTGNKYEDNVFELTAPSFTSVDPMGFVGGGGQTYSRNLLTGGLAALSGQATITPGTNSVVVTNANAMVSYSRVQLQAMNPTGASTSVYVTLGAGNFVITTGSGANVAANATYAWNIE